MDAMENRRYITTNVANETVRGLELIQELKGFGHQGEAIDWLVRNVMLIPGTTVGEAVAHLSPR